MDKLFSAWGNGFMGVLIFSASLPATRMAVADFDPVFLTAARASIAALLGLGLIAVFKVRRPAAGDWLSLSMVAVGVVVGFPLLTALALEQASSAAHTIVFIGMLPLFTALFGVLRDGEKPTLGFWLISALGSAIVVLFAVAEGFQSSWLANSYMLAAIVICGLGYAEGARLSRKLGGWQVISWALLLSSPVTVSLAFFTYPASLQGVSASAWAGLAYVSLFSMLIGFVFWYRGLAQGGIASVGQLQLLQPFLGLMLAALLLGERISPSMLLCSLGVVLCVVGARRLA